MELRLRVTRKRVAIFVAALALVATGAAIGVTSNAYTDAQGVYHGCVNTSNGNLRVLASGETCKSSEVAIDWNQVGPQGPQGIQGLKGDQGDQGIQGIQGLKGDKGDQGIQGIQGLKGDKGDQGDQGDQGIQGIQGIQGVKGDTGAQGPAGGGLSGVTTVTAETQAGLFSSNAVDATCPDGKIVIGGGGRTGLAETGATGNILMSHPAGNGWHVRAYNGGPFVTVYITAYAICADG